MSGKKVLVILMALLLSVNSLGTLVYAASGSDLDVTGILKAGEFDRIYGLVNLSTDEFTLYKNATKKIGLTGLESYMTVTWSSDDKKIATVNQKGVVTAKKAGYTWIYAKIKGNYGAVCRKMCCVNVKNPTLKLSKTKLTLTAGGSQKIKATVKGKSKTVKWKSSNKAVATVTKKGKITAKKPGTAVITATANGVKKKCKVTVKAKAKTYSSSGYSSSGSSSGSSSSGSSSSGSSSSSSSSTSFSGSGSTTI